MQSSPASASGGQSLKRGLGNPKSSHLPQSNPGSAWDWAFPARGREKAREPVAGPSSQSNDSHKGQLGGKVPETPLLNPSKVQISFSSLHTSLQNGRLEECMQGPKRFLAGHLQTSARHSASSLRPKSFPRRTPCPSAPSCVFDTCQVARSHSSALPTLPCKRESLNAYLDDKLTKSPPSSSRTLQKRTPFTKGTAVSSSKVKVVWNLNFFFFIKKAMSEFPESEARRAKKKKGKEKKEEEKK